VARDEQLKTLGEKLLNTEKLVEQVSRELAAERKAFGAERDALQASIRYGELTLTNERVRAARAKRRWFYVGLAAGGITVAVLKRR
jgi:hypothetical protein